MLSISFDFDESTQKITNLKVTSSDSKTTTPKTVTKNKYDLEVLDNKLSFTPEAIQKLGAEVGDRIAVNYWNESPTETYPIISKADVFTDGADGNKRTKSNTVSFRGQQRTTLLKFGSAFSFEEWKDRSGEVKEGVFKLIPVKIDDTDNDSIVEEETTLNNMNQSKIEDEIAEMLNEEERNEYDDLPF